MTIETFPKAAGAPGSVELSAALMVYNERHRIERCLEGLWFCDEIVVVDDGSTDGTYEYLRDRARDANGKLRVFQHRHTTFAAQRQLVKDQTIGRWVLTMDGDEYVRPEYAAIMKRAIADPHAPDGFYVRLKSPYPKTLTGFEIGEHPRLIRTEKCQWMKTESPHSWLELAGLRMKVLGGGHMDHEPLDDLPSALRKAINRTIIVSAQLRARGKTAGGLRAFASAFARFFRFYVMRGAFRFGSSGFLMAALNGFEGFCKYAFLAEKRTGAEERLLDGGAGSYPKEALRSELQDGQKR
jgi:glycosyltransferase involved in cell wall biosynthesis